MTAEAMKISEHIFNCYVSITSSEWRLLTYLRYGFTNDKIALAEASETESIKARLKTLYRKIGVNNRTQAAVYFVHNCGAAASESDDKVPNSPFSDREVECLKYICRGFTNKEIAQAMHIGEETIKSKIKAIFKKTNSSNRATLAADAEIYGWTISAR